MRKGRLADPNSAELFTITDPDDHAARANGEPAEQPSVDASHGVLDTGLAALVMMAAFLETPADAGQIKHQFGVPGRLFDETNVPRAALDLGFKARAVSAKWDRLKKTPLNETAFLSVSELMAVARCVWG